MTDNTITLRPYQEECMTIAFQKYEKGVTRQLIVAATGVGKRLMAVQTSVHFNTTLFIAHREELIEQAVLEFDELYPGQVGIIKGPRFEIDDRYKVVVASAQTIYRRLEKIPVDRFELVIVDEAHHFVAKTFIKPLHYFKPKLMQGYTATPTRLDGLNFSNIFDEIIFTYDIAEAVKDKYLCELDAVRVKTQIDLSSLHKVAGDFNQKELSMSVDIPARNELVVDKYLQYAKDRQAIVFGVDIQHAINLADTFKKRGITAQAVHSELDHETRKAINASFKRGDLEVLTNVEILTEGWDYFDVGAVCMARPTQSLAMYMQMIGRGTRLKSIEFIETEFKINIREDAVANNIDYEKLTYTNKGCTFFKHYNSDLFSPAEQDFIQKYYYKANCKILDFVDNSGKHALINTWELDKKKHPSKQVFITEANRELKLFQEKQRREAVIKSTFRDDKVVNLLALPVMTVYHSGRMLELATEGQIEWLRSEGVWQEGVEYTKGQASEFITNFDAKDWQLRKLAEWGFDITLGATTGQYYSVKREREQSGSYTPFR